MNGQGIAGATGETLEVPWTQSNQIDTYTVTALYSVDGNIVPGEAKSAQVLSSPTGMTVIIR